MALKYHGELDAAALSDPNNTHARVLSLVGSRKRVLEIGCATGYMTRVMVLRQACQVTALEIDSEAAELARKSGATVLTGDVEVPGTIERLGGPFDIIVMADVLEHLRDPWSVLCRLRPLLSPGGSLVVSLPNVAHYTLRAALLRGRFNYMQMGILDIGHLRFFTRKSAAGLLRNSGYQIDRIEATYAFPKHRRHGLGRLFAARRAPVWFQELFACQFIIRATAA